jgi:hypothetical protein
MWSVIFSLSASRWFLESSSAFLMIYFLFVSAYCGFCHIYRGGHLLVSKTTHWAWHFVKIFANILSRKIGLSQIYTNHSAWATGATILGKGFFFWCTGQVCNRTQIVICSCYVLLSLLILQPWNTGIACREMERIELLVFKILPSVDCVSSISLLPCDTS